MKGWIHNQGDTYEITGTLVNGRRFKPIRLSDPNMIRHYNIWRGTVWVHPKEGTGRMRLYSIHN